MVQSDTGDAAEQLAGAADEDLVTTVDGPLGKAEIYEISQQFADGDIRYEYQVRFGGKTETFKTIGEASAVAGEKVGVRR